jgi:predicted outer membrane protein
LVAAVPALAAGQAGSVQLDERELAERLHADNLREIKLGQLTLVKARTEEARQVAESIIRDHQEADRQLTAMARERGWTLRAPRAKSDVERNRMQMVNAADELLRTVDPAQYDSLYLALMVAEHDHTLHQIAMATRGQISGEARTMLRRLVPMLQQHREQAAKGLVEIKVGGPESGVGGAGSQHHEHYHDAGGE